MREGLLWFDDNPDRSLYDKILRAVRRYRQKFGYAPTVCRMNTAQFAAEDVPELVESTMVEAGRAVLPDHFWVGVGEAHNDTSQAQCPSCGRWQDDLDGFGVIHCECGYCAHPARTGGVCDVCGEEEKCLTF